jgi:hypothetical protein
MASGVRRTPRIFVRFIRSPEIHIAASIRKKKGQDHNVFNRNKASAFLEEKFEIDVIASPKKIKRKIGIAVSRPTFVSEKRPPKTTMAIASESLSAIRALVHDSKYNSGDVATM